jgi:crossover junction endodeoxyribonuclease RuvC
MIKAVYIGIDPGGTSGAVVAHIVGKDDTVNSIDIEFGKSTDAEIAKFFKRLSGVPCYACIEKVHAMPGQGVTSTFSFGQNYGFIKGVLSAYLIPYEEVTPQTWMRKFKAPIPVRKVSEVVKRELADAYKKECKVQGVSFEKEKLDELIAETKSKFKKLNATAKLDHKKELRNIAQNKYPSMKITAKLADACLIADYCMMLKRP